MPNVRLEDIKHQRKLNKDDEDEDAEFNTAANESQSIQK